MPAMIRDIVDLPNVATAADGTNQLVGVCALFAGAVDFCGWFCPGTVTLYLFPLLTPLFSRPAVVGAIGSATACQL